MNQPTEYQHVINSDINAPRGTNKLSKVIEILEEGVAKVGRVGLLWKLLGNCYSDAGRFVKAEKAYVEALAREGCDCSVVHLTARSRSIGTGDSPKRKEPRPRRFAAPSSAGGRVPHT